MAERVRYENAKLIAFVASTPKRADALAEKLARTVSSGAKERAPVDTGALRNSIDASREATALWLVTVGAAYASYVEWGTSRQSAKPFLYPALMAAARQVGELARVEFTP